MNPKLVIEEYSHGARLSKYTRETFQHLSLFLEGLALKEPRRLPANQGGRMVMELKKRYYGLTKNHREVFIHRHHVEAVIKFLRDRGIAPEYIQRVPVPVPEAAPAQLEVKSHFKPRDYQEVIIGDLVDEHYSRRLDLYTGGGKAQPLDAKIKVPGGWSTMGDMKVGTRVIAPDGSTTEVTGVYPQGEKTIYRITFEDGRTTEACGEHLWLSELDAPVSPDERGPKVRSTEELMRLCLTKSYRDRLYIPLVEPEEGPDLDLPLDPYLLGVILGAGGILANTVTITKTDPEVFDTLADHLPPGAVLSKRAVSERSLTYDIVGTGEKGGNPVVNSLRGLGLTGTTSEGRFIPTIYLEGSRAQRVALLQGLMDAVGDVRQNGSVYFNSASQRLAGGVQYLVRSLGGLAKLSPKQTYYTYRGVRKLGKPSYRVVVRMWRPTDLFRLPRKRDRLKEVKQYAERLKLRIKHIEPAGVKVTQCISVAHKDRLYVTDDFIVTHNTFCALAAAAIIGERLLIMIPPKYFGIWTKALLETYVDIEGRYVTVSGSAELQALINRGLEGTLDHDVILLSNVTYRGYIEAYERYINGIEELGYNVPPPRFHEAIGVGLQINDEIQEDPGLVFRTDIFTNVKKQFYLSATPYSGSEYVTRMIEEMLPPHTQCEIPKYKEYINVIGLLYNDPTVQPKDYLTPFKNTYNHARYEKRMLKQKRRLDRYFHMIKRITDGIYVKDRQPGQKLLILCAYVEFIKELTRYLQQQYPQLKVRSYVSGTPYAELLENDITVSTIKSAGTGVDIPNLREVLLCQATDSKKDNIQILGRTRPLKDWPDVSPRLTYLVCSEIPQHVRYHNNKKEHFNGRALTHRVMRV